MKLFPKKKTKKKYKKLLEKINSDEGRQSINDLLLSETRLLLEEASEGSILLKIKGCNTGAIKAVFGDNVKAGISRVLRIVLPHLGMDKHSHNGKVEVVKVGFDKTANNDHDRKGTELFYAYTLTINYQINH